MSTLGPGRSSPPPASLWPEAWSLSQARGEGQDTLRHLHKGKLRPTGACPGPGKLQKPEPVSSGNRVCGFLKRRAVRSGLGAMPLGLEHPPPPTVLSGHHI